MATASQGSSHSEHSTKGPSSSCLSFSRWPTFSPFFPTEAAPPNDVKPPPQLVPHHLEPSPAFYPVGVAIPDDANAANAGVD